VRIDGSTGLVTGADRGLGRAFAQELVARGAARVYGTARNAADMTDTSIQPISLDITDPQRVAQVARQCLDVNLLVNNAGIMLASSFLGTPTLEAARSEMEVNYFGTLSMSRAFAPVLRSNGGGALVNMLSVTSFYNNPLEASYGASKSAGWSLTNGLRTELAHQGTLVVAVHASFIDPDMAAGTDAPKISPESVAQQVFDAVEADEIELLVDERSRFIKASLSRDHELIYPAVQEFWDSIT
jgi:NAD(P)-dependent dehydrogenase (short-subunit alcohol dehydrogenase family)